MKRAIALCGGGTKGAYELGAWKAMVELGIDYQIVTGTSIGSINGALMTTKDYELGCKIWDTIQMENVMSDGVNMSLTIESMYNQRESLRPFLKKYVKNKGADISPFKEFIDEMIDEEKIRASDIDYGLVTVKFSSLKPLELTKSEIPHGKLKDYIMASSSIFPIFPMHNIENEMYLDGCYYDNLPIDLALKMGADEVVAIDLHTSPSHPNYVNKPYITYISPSVSLGNMLNFDRDVLDKNQKLGYQDVMKAFGQMDGSRYSFYQKELDCYQREIRDFVTKVARSEACLTEGVLNKFVKPGDGKRLCGTIEEHVKKKTYTRQDYFIGAAEICGEIFKIPNGELWEMSKFVNLLFSRIKGKEEYPEMEIFQGKGNVGLATKIAELKLKKESAYITGCIYHAFLTENMELSGQLAVLTFLPYELAAVLFLLTMG